MTTEQMKAAVCKAVDNNAEFIIALGESIFKEPELGYKEFKTAQKVKDVWNSLGYEYTENVAVTGVNTVVKGRKGNAKIAIMGEMDAVVSASHPFADPVTKAAHACGHNVQVAAMVGMAKAMKEAGVMEYLDGDIAYMAVPSEELVELEFRNQLIKEGKISYLGGKQEYIKLGVFDDIDCAIMQHTVDGNLCTPGGTENGRAIIAKLVHYHGKAAHAGCPWDGVNALNAAKLGLTAIDAIRDTFRFNEQVAIHPIITKGGELVNVVPSEVHVETFCRATSMEGVIDASVKTDRALKAGADALGATVDIYNIPGCMLPFEDKVLQDTVYNNLVSLVGEEGVTEGLGFSSDVNDLGQVIPTVQIHIGGSAGIGHGADYRRENKEMAYLVAAKVMAMTAIDLLSNEAALAKSIKSGFDAPLTKQEFFNIWNGIL